MHHNRLIKQLLKVWVGYKLPDVHVFTNEKTTARVFLKKWFLHPLKRRIARQYLIILRKYFSVKVIGITGSAGKTSTKEMLFTILSTENEVVASYKNIDPIYNIPDTILKCSPRTKYLILEMGVEYPGEMDFYLWLAKPDISVITNINPTHLQYFKSVKNVYLEKIKIAKALQKNDYVVLNVGDNHLKSAGSFINSHIQYFGKESSIFASNISVNNMSSIYTLHINNDKLVVHLPVLGNHFIENSLAAVAVSHILKIKNNIIKKGLENYHVPEHRMNIVKEKNGTLIIDDTYNSNPAAAKEALITFEDLTKMHKYTKKGIVFGEMLELGNKSVYYHREIGKYISKMKVDFLICVGKETTPLMREVKSADRGCIVVGVEKTGDVYEILKKYLGKERLILLKGSRSVGLDRVVEKLLG